MVTLGAGLGGELARAVRALARDRAFSATVVVTLALGIGATTAGFGLVEAVVLRPLPFADQDRLVVAWKKDLVASTPWVEVAYAEFADWRAQSASFSGLAALPTLAYGQGFVLTGHGDPALLESTRVTGRFFPLLGVAPALGRVLDEGDDRADAPKVVVVSHRLWRERLGADPAAVGRPIVLTGEPYVVVGVMPPAFDFPKGVDLWTAFVPMVPAAALNNRGVTYLQVVGRLRPGVTLGQAATELDTIIARVARQHPETEARGHRVVMTPLVAHLLGSARTALWSLLAATGLLLLIACANVAHLSLARGSARRGELALRAALGAGRWRIARQLAAESAVLATAAGGLGLLVARALLAWLVRTAPPDIPRLADVELGNPGLVFAAAVTLLTAALFGVLPAWTSARVDLSEALGEAGGRLAGGRRGTRLRAGLVAAEVAVALVLLVGGSLVARSFLNLRELRLGFDPRHVLTMQLTPRGAAYREPETRRAFFRRLVERLEAEPGVEGASAVLVRPMEGAVGWDTTYAAEGQPEAEARHNPVANFEVVSPHYFRVLGTPLVAGRAFAATDTMDAPPVVIVSQALAIRLFGSGPAAVGKRMTADVAGGASRTVVGVAADVRYRELRETNLDVYVPFEQSPRAHVNHFALRTRTPPEAFLPVVRRELAALDPDQALSAVATLEELVAAQEARPRFNAVLFNWLSSLALLLALVGVYGVVACAVGERTGELGIRVALGAQGADISRLVLVDGLRPVVIGVTTGLAAALALGRLVEALLFGLHAADPATLAGAAGAVAASAFLASWIPAARAARLDPVVALRRLGGR
jgi:putative ABC transport system permease protein